MLDGIERGFETRYFELQFFNFFLGRYTEVSNFLCIRVVWYIIRMEDVGKWGF